MHEFKNAPLVQAACRLTLGTPVPLNMQLVLGLVRELSSDYSVVRDPFIHEVPPGRSEADESGTILGVTFVSPREGVILTFQSDLIVCAWVKMAQSDAPKYPRFARLKAAAAEAKRALVDVLEGKDPGVDVVNISYTDLIVGFGERGDATIRRYFEPGAWIGLTAGATEVKGFNIQWEEPDGIETRFSLRSSPIRYPVGESEDVLPAFIVEWVGGSKVEAEMDSLQRLQEVHDKLLDVFVRALTKHAKDEWGYIND